MAIYRIHYCTPYSVVYTLCSTKYRSADEIGKQSPDQVTFPSLDAARIPAEYQLSSDLVRHGSTDEIQLQNCHCSAYTVQSTS